MMFPMSQPWLGNLRCTPQSYVRASSRRVSGDRPALPGQPFRNFDKCAYESGLQMQGDATSHTYWLHLNCKQGEVDLAQIVLFGRHLESKDIQSARGSFPKTF